MYVSSDELILGATTDWYEKAVTLHAEHDERETASQQRPDLNGRFGPNEN